MSSIAIVLTSRFADWEYALIGGTGGPFYGLDVRYFSPTAGTLQSQGGLEVTVTQDLDALTRWIPSAVAVIGGMTWETQEAPDLGDFLQLHHERGAFVAGICGGTLALARAGLLEEVRHTSNDPEFLTANASAYSGTEHYVRTDSAVSDNRVITAPGTAPVGFTAALFEGVGLERQLVRGFEQMMAAEHS